MSEAERGESK